MKLVRMTLKDTMEIGSKVLKRWNIGDKDMKCVFDREGGYYELTNTTSNRVWLIPMSYAIGEFEPDDSPSAGITATSTTETRERKPMTEEHKRKIAEGRRKAAEAKAGQTL